MQEGTDIYMYMYSMAGLCYIYYIKFILYLLCSNCSKCMLSLLHFTRLVIVHVHVHWICMIYFGDNDNDYMCINALHFNIPSIQDVVTRCAHQSGFHVERIQVWLELSWTASQVRDRQNTRNKSKNCPPILIYHVHILHAVYVSICMLYCGMQNFHR